MATGILAMLAKPKGGGKGMEDEGPPSSRPGSEMGGDEVGDALMEMFDSLKAGDGKGAGLAFRRAKEACDDSYSSEEPDEMGEEKDDLDL